MATDAASSWLARHGRAETALAADLRRYFLAQAREFLAAIADVDNPTVDDVAATFDIDGQHKRLLVVATPHIVRAMAAGAISQSPSRQRRKAADDVGDADDVGVGDGDALVIGELADFKLPDYAREAAKGSFKELVVQPFWRGIQQATQTSITDILQSGLENGDAGHTIAKNIREVLGENAKVRAKAIARTETTAAYNSGHQAMFDTLAVDGLITGKTWLAILDADVRADHSALNEKTVEVKKNFDVGGYPAPYPAHWSLPAEQRVNCRCTVVSAFDF